MKHIFSTSNQNMLQMLNLTGLRKGISPMVDLIYADMIYENLDFEWTYPCNQILKQNGIFIVQTDYHSVAELKIFMTKRLELNLVNWCIYKQEWGGTSKRYFPKKHDDILIFSKGLDYKFYPERVMIPKATAGTALDKNGGMKIPCDVFDDLGNFMTTSKERIKVGGHNIQWQKPMKLMERLLAPFTDELDTVLDPFMGSGSTGEWCIRNNRNFIGFENDGDVFAIAEKRLENVEKEMKK